MDVTYLDDNDWLITNCVNTSKVYSDNINSSNDLSCACSASVVSTHNVDTNNTAANTFNPPIPINVVRDPKQRAKHFIDMINNVDKIIAKKGVHSPPKKMLT